MDRDITPECTLQLIARFRDNPGNAYDDIAELDPWQLAELACKLIALFNVLLEDSAEARGITGDEILWGFMGEIKEMNE
jgi:hypothetical protein